MSAQHLSGHSMWDWMAFADRRPATAAASPQFDVHQPFRAGSGQADMHRKQATITSGHHESGQGCCGRRQWPDIAQAEQPTTVSSTLRPPAEDQGAVGMAGLINLIYSSPDLAYMAKLGPAQLHSLLASTVHKLNGATPSASGLGTAPDPHSHALGMQASSFANFGVSQAPEASTHALELSSYAPVLQPDSTSSLLAGQMDACDDELLSFLAPAAGADASRDASAGPASPQLLSASPETTAAVDNMLLARMHCQPYPAYHRPQMSLLSSPGELGGLDLLPRSPTLPHMAGGAHQAYMGSMLTGVPPATWRDQVPQPRSQQIHIMQAALPSTDPAASQQLRQILQQGSAGRVAAASEPAATGLAYACRPATCDASQPVWRSHEAGGFSSMGQAYVTAPHSTVQDAFASSSACIDAPTWGAMHLTPDCDDTAIPTYRGRSQSLPVFGSGHGMPADRQQLPQHAKQLCKLLELQDAAEKHGIAMHLQLPQHVDVGMASKAASMQGGSTVDAFRASSLPALKCPMKHARRMSAEPVPMSRLGEDHEPSAVAPEVDGMQEARRVRRRRQNAEASQRSRQKKRLQRQLLQSQIAELQDAKDVVKRRIQAAACLPACAQTGARLAEDSGIYPYGGLEEQLAQLVTDLKEKRQELARLGVPKTGYRSN